LGHIELGHITVCPTDWPLLALFVTRHFAYLFNALALLCAFTAGACNAGTLLLSDHSPQTLVGVIDYLRDPDRTLNFEQLTATTAFDDHWQTGKEEALNFGYTADRFWFRYDIRNAESSSVERILEISYPVIDNIDIHIQGNNAIELIILGDKLPFAQRPIMHRNFIVPLRFEAGETKSFLMYVDTSSSMQIPISIWRSNDFIDREQTSSLVQGLYFGCVGIMFFYNLFVFLSLREPGYFWYVMYVLSMAVVVAAINGLSFQYLWPVATQWNDRSIIIALASLVLFVTLFTRDFLRIPEHRLRWLNHFFIALAAICIFMLAAAFFVSYVIMIVSMILIALIGIIFALVTGVIRMLEGYAPARLYVVAWTTMLAGGAILAFNKYGIIPRNPLTENALQVGSAIEVFLLSLALAHRLNVEKSERDAAQRTALVNERDARESQQHLLELKQKAVETLETRVRERTLDLERANRKLQELSLTDGLTGLFNRRHFDESFELQFKRAVRDKTPLAILMIDADHFKRINDTWGHLAGDDCLVAIASVLRHQARRENDLVARFGGEEFAVLLMNTEPEHAMRIAEGIRLGVENAIIEISGEPLALTISIGVAAITPSAESHPSQLLHAADEALYAAKSSGRNRVNCATLVPPEKRLK
jgi:two-component system, sensor histidine kinase LadS